MSSILLVGSGGHFNSVIDTIENLDIYDNIGVVSNVPFNHPYYVGTDEDLPRLRNEFEYIFLALTNKSFDWKSNYYENASAFGFKIPIIIDKRSYVSKKAKIDKGVFIGKLAIINANVKIGFGSIINTASNIEHDSSIGKYCHIAPGAILLGQVKVDDNVFVGAGSTLRENINIGRNAIIGMASNVISSVPANIKVVGNPAKELK